MARNIKVTGQKEIKKNLAKFTKKKEARLTKTLSQLGRRTLAKSKKITPKDKGALRKSGFWRIEKKPRGPQVRVGYNDPKAPFVHEMPAEFNYTTPGTGPKFLEKVIRASRSEYLKMMRKAFAIPGGSRKGRK